MGGLASYMLSVWFGASPVIHKDTTKPRVLLDSLENGRVEGESMAMLQDLDRIVGHHKMAYLGGEPNDDAGADTTSPGRTEGAYHTCPPMWSDCSHCTGLAQVDE